MPNVHYLWVGPPASAPYLGHDTIGPDLMRQKYADLPIHFWCLEEQVPHFQTHFEDQHVTVHAIEPFVKRDDPEFYEFILALTNRASLHVSRKDSAREYTTMKAAMQFFLQIHFDGYFLDSNIIPDPSVDDRPLKDYQRFAFPFGSREMDFYDDDEFIDPWMMYSPRGDKKAMLRFNEYFLIAAKEFAERGLHEPIDRLTLGTAFVHMAKYSYGLALPVDPGERFYDTLRVSGLQKRYYNSHRANSGLNGPIAHRILSGPHSPDELTYLLKLTDFDSTAMYFNGPPGVDTEMTSLLQTAIKKGKTEALPILLAYAKNLTTKELSNYVLEAFDYFQLNQQHTHKTCLITLLNVYIQTVFHDDTPLFLQTAVTINALLKPNSDPKAEIQQAFETVHSTSHYVDTGLMRNTLALILRLGPVNEDTFAHYEKNVRANKKQSLYGARQGPSKKMRFDSSFFEQTEPETDITEQLLRRLSPLDRASEPMKTDACTML